MPTCSLCQTTLSPTDQFCSHCGEAVALDGADLPLSTAIAHASQLLVRGEIDQAIALLLPHAMATDADPRASFALGTAYLQRGRYADALPFLLEAVEGEPGNAHAHAYLAMAYLLTYQPADAREAMNRATTLAPDDGVVNLKHGELLFRLGYYRECIVPLERALAVPAPDGATLAFTRRLLQLARQKAPNTFTRPVNPLPRFSWFRRKPRHGAIGGTALPIPALDHPSP